MISTPKIIFVAGAISQPRIIKRIRSFKNGGLDVIVYAFDRGNYTVNSKEIDFPVIMLGKQEDGRDYLSKIKQYYLLHKKLKSSHDVSKDIFYFFGFPIALFTLFTSMRYVYEISDILYGYKRFNLIRPLLRRIDRVLVKRSILTVMTSGGFKTFLFRKKEQNNIVIQANKLSPYFSSFNRNDIDFTCQNNKGIVFSFIGAFRYPNTIFRFAEVIGKHFPQHIFKFHGDSIYREEVKSIANKYENVKYFGEYKNPDDLVDLYDGVDFIVACYDPEGLNERIAEPNKLYEAVFFKKPIVVSSNTYLEQQVLSFGCGFAIDATKDENIISFIESLSNESLQEIKENIGQVLPKELIDDDGEIIIKKILELY